MTHSGWTRHGHRIPGCIAIESERPPAVARCGGPAICGTCSTDVAVALFAQLGTAVGRHRKGDPEPGQ